MEELINQMELLLQKMKECQKEYGNDKPRSTGKISDLFLNKVTYEIKVAGVVKILTRSEYSLIKELLDSEDMFCSYEKLVRALYGFNTDSASIRSLAVMVARTRKTLEGLIKIKTVRNKGYIITEVKGYDKNRLL